MCVSVVEAWSIFPRVASWPSTYIFPDGWKANAVITNVHQKGSISIVSLAILRVKCSTFAITVVFCFNRVVVVLVCFMW